MPFYGPISIAVTQDIVALLHSAEGRVILIDVDRRVYQLLGQSGQGPGDVPRPGLARAAIALSQNGFVAILDPVQRTVRVWDTAGQVQWFQRIGDPTWGFEPLATGRGRGIWFAGFGLDSAGRAYVPVGEWEGDSVRIAVLRLGPEQGDSTILPLITTDGPVRLPLPGGRQGLHYIRTDYVKARGAVYWVVESGGLVFRARGDSLRVDTLRHGRRPGTWFRRPQAAERAVPEEELRRVLRGHSIGGRQILPSDVMPLRYAVVRQLFVTASEVWIGTEASGVGWEYEVVDRITQATRRIGLGTPPVAVSDRWAVTWSNGPDGELQLDIFDLDDPVQVPAQPAPLTLRPARVVEAPRNLDSTLPLARSRPDALRAEEPASQDRLAHARLAFSVGCSTTVARSRGGRVEIELGSAKPGSSVLRIESTGASFRGRTRAVLTAMGGAGSSCESAGEIRFDLAGRLPDTLSLIISGPGATVTVVRSGVEIVAPIRLADSTSLTVPLRIAQ